MSIGKMSKAKAAVLTELLSRPAEAHWGYDLMKRTRLSSGTLYPMLSQLERAGWVHGGWEFDKKVQGGPPRKAYRLTAEGMRAAPAVLAEFAARRMHGRGRPIATEA